MSKKIKWITLICSILIGGVIGGVIYTSILYNDVSSTLKSIHEPTIRKVSERRITEVELVKKQPISILLLGVDEKENDKGRSDIMIILTVNPSTNSTKMVSIPRDTYTEFIGNNKLDKINHAYSFGGIDLALYTTENLLNIPIDYVLQVNMKSFVEIVTIIGGITVDNSTAFQMEDFTFKKGEIHLNGEQALNYVQMRHDDPLGDFGRQERQKQVLQAILKKGSTINSLWNYKDFLTSIQHNIKTNMTFEQMIDIQKGYKDALHNIEPVTFQNGEGKIINDVWYYMMDEEELENITCNLKEHLEIK